MFKTELTSEAPNEVVTVTAESIISQKAADRLAELALAVRLDPLAFTVTGSNHPAFKK